MFTEENMTIDERYKYLRKMQPHYRKANRREKGRLLDEMTYVTGLNRKRLSTLMNSVIQRRPRHNERGVTYGPDVDDALRVIAESFDYICPERLTPNLPWMAEVLAAHGELATTPELLAQLATISIATVGRRLRRIRQDEPRLPRRGPTQANKVARQVPIRIIPWNEQTPGHMEVDLVHHCGPTTAGEYVHTLQLIDVATGWSERVAILGRGALVVIDALRYVRQRLLFPILELHVDNGKEFLNQHLLRICQHAWPDVVLTRSRPYRNNDNRFVEQKNDTLVRAFFGTDRLDSVAQTQALNILYDDMWLYYNGFQPVMRLVEKTSVTDDHGRMRVKRRYDQARTPFDRLCDTGLISDVHRTEFEQRRRETNPRALRRKIYAAIEALFKIPGAVPGQSEDVYETLFFLNDILDLD